MSVHIIVVVYKQLQLVHVLINYPFYKHHQRFPQQISEIVNHIQHQFIFLSFSLLTVISIPLYWSSDEELDRCDFDP